MTRSPEPLKYVRGSSRGTSPKFYYWTHASFIHYMINLYLTGNDFSWMVRMDITEVDELPFGEHATKIHEAGY